MCRGCMKKDQLFADPRERVSPFEFNEQVAAVFDDMLTRSVPLYCESIRQQAGICRRFFQPGTRIYDLGCSHGNLGILIGSHFAGQPFDMIGVDSSGPMIEKYRKRLETEDFRDNVTLLKRGAETVEIKTASIVIVNLTLQFIDPDKRDDLIQKIFQGLVPGGVLLLTEKVTHDFTSIADLQQECYRNFKKENGYSDLEISQKRDALERVLIPETVETHEGRLERAGFQQMDLWLKWFNFASIMAVKER